MREEEEEEEVVVGMGEAKWEKKNNSINSIVLDVKFNKCFVSRNNSSESFGSNYLPVFRGKPLWKGKI